MQEFCSPENLNKLNLLIYNTSNTNITKTNTLINFTEGINTAILNYLTNQNNQTNGFFDGICDHFKLPYISKADKELLNIGYSHMSWPFILIPCVALILNLFMVITYIRKDYKNTKKLNAQLNGEQVSTIDEEEEVRQNSSMEKMIFYLTCIETLISITWLINGFVFVKLKKIEERCIGCFVFSLVTSYFQCLDWLFFGLCLNNLITIIDDPMKEYNFDQRKKYLLIGSTVISGLYTFLIFITNIYGTSPMLMCGIRNHWPDENDKIIALYFIICLPFIYVVYCIVTFVRIFNRRKVKKNKELTKSTVKFLIYASLYILFYFPTFVLYLITINTKIEPKTPISWISYYCSLSNLVCNLILCCTRLLEGYVDCSWKAFMPNDDLEDNLIDKENIHELGREDGSLHSPSHNRKKQQQSILSMTSNFLKVFIRDVFIGLSLTIYRSKEEVEILNEKQIRQKFINETNTYIFDSNNRLGKSGTNNHSIKSKRISNNLLGKSSTLKSNNGNNGNNNNLNRIHTIETHDSTAKEDKKDYFQILNMDNLLEEDPCYVKIIEYAPRVFKLLREIDNIKTEEIIKSLSPLDNTALGKSQGASDALFIATDDSRYIIKTVSSSDFNCIFSHNFLTFYLLNIKNNPESLICRMYGIFSVYSENNGVPLTVMILKNARGPFTPYIRATYDLKGSTVNREVKLPSNYKSPSELYMKVRKDINFEKDIKSMQLKTSDSFIESAINDSSFFEDLGIMDYSLLIYRLELTDKELSELKASELFKAYENYFYEADENEYIYNHKNSNNIDRIDEVNEDENDNSNSNNNNNNIINKKSKESIRKDNDKKQSLTGSDEIIYENNSKTSINNDKINHAYVIFIIDYLQLYTRNKKMESFMKGMIYNSDISSQPPDLYSERFIKFVKNIAGN